jgi:hypothetical protein
VLIFCELVGCGDNNRKDRKGSTYPFLNMSEIVDIGVRTTDQEMPNLKKNPSISGRHVLYGFFYQETPSLSDVT